MATVTIYGTYESESTRQAQDYFQDCDGSVRYVDLWARPMDAMVLYHFLWEFPVRELVDMEGAAYQQLAGKRESVPDGELLSKIGSTPGLLRLPLVRCGGHLVVGNDERGWGRIAAGISSKG